jgi:hypothetical protein
MLCASMFNIIPGNLATKGRDHGKEYMGFASSCSILIDSDRGRSKQRSLQRDATSIIR